MHVPVPVYFEFKSANCPWYNVKNVCEHRPAESLFGSLTVGADFDMQVGVDFDKQSGVVC